MGRIGWWAVAFMILSQSAAAGEPSPLSSKKDRESYALGVEMARNIRQEGVEVDPDLLVKGVRDGLSGAPLLLGDDELISIRKDLQMEQVRRVKASMQAANEKGRRSAVENRKAGEVFLAENAKKAGVTTLPSGLQYQVVATGAGKVPSDGDTVEVRYRGTRIDGTEFDRSVKTATLKVDSVIPGWREALKLMPAGSTWRLFVPPVLGYGEKGAGRIPPGSTLVFEVELVAVR